MNDPYWEVGKSPLNNSPTKQLYSFPKADRFNYAHKSYCDAFYDIKPIHNEKSTGFGHARKNTEIVRCDSPSPDRYRLKTEFDKNIDDKKGFKFGSGKRDSYIVTEQLKGYPGPGAYNHKMDKYINVAFSMAGKLQNLELKKANPVGPGQYRLQNMSQTGEYFNSKFRNTGSAKISKSPRFNYRGDGIPGPGAYRYEDKTGLSKDGNYYNSKFKASRAVKFSPRPSQSPTKDRSTSPGPGAYRQFSQFGRRPKSALKT